MNLSEERLKELASLINFVLKHSHAELKITSLILNEFGVDISDRWDEYKKVLLDMILDDVEIVRGLRISMNSGDRNIFKDLEMGDDWWDVAESL